MQKIFSLLFVVFFQVFIQAQSFELKFFPAEKFYEKYFADALSHQFSLGKHLESRQWFGNIGASIPLFNFGYGKYIIQASAAATVFNTIIKTPGHIQVYTVDYLVDFFGDYSFTDELRGRFIFGHLSAHYSDDGIIELNNYSISYVRDYVGLHFQFLPDRTGIKLYSGVFYNFHNEPALNRHFTFQGGCEYHYSLSEDIAVYAAADLKLKSEVEYGSTQSFQAGIIFPAAEEKYFRLAYTHRRGFEERGQIYNLKDIKNSITLYFDF